MDSSTDIIDLYTLRYKKVLCCCLETIVKTNLIETKSILHSQANVLNRKEWRVNNGRKKERK